MNPVLATCINYAKINNSLLCTRGHVSATFYRCDVLFLQGNTQWFSSYCCKWFLPRCMECRRGL